MYRKINSIRTWNSQKVELLSEITSFLLLKFEQASYLFQFKDFYVPFMTLQSIDFIFNAKIMKGSYVFCCSSCIIFNSTSHLNKIDLFDETKIARQFNFFVTNIKKTLATKIPNAAVSFKYFVNKSDFVMKTKALLINELKEHFYSSRSNKNPGYGNISYNVIKIKYFFHLPFEKGVFPDDLKIVWVSVNLIDKGGDSSDVSIYRPISVLPCFSKILERIMFYLIGDDILYSEQFAYQNGHLTDHALVQLADIHWYSLVYRRLLTLYTAPFSLTNWFYIL